MFLSNQTTLPHEMAMSLRTYRQCNNFHHSPTNCPIQQPRCFQQGKRITRFQRGVTLLGLKMVLRPGAVLEQLNSALPAQSANVSGITFRITNTNTISWLDKVSHLTDLPYGIIKKTI